MMGDEKVDDLAESLVFVWVDVRVSKKVVWSVAEMEDMMVAFWVD